MRLPLIASLVLPAIALGDAGILGSVVRGPSALSDSGPAVRMLAQDVLISLDRCTYEITGCFLLHSPGEEGTVYMYFPVDIITPFSTQLYSSIDPDPLLERVDVTVDGVTKEVFPLFICEWDPSAEPGLTWDSIRETTMTLFPGEPGPGEPFYATRIPSQGELTGTYENLDSPGIRCQALNAAWSTDFGADDTVLVEYHVTGRMTLDYDSTFSIFCYPLQTGSTWEGTIGRGRVIVVTEEPEAPGIITFIAGSMLPPAESLPPSSFEPLPEIAGHPAFDATRLSRLADTSHPGGFEWNFSDFEPSTVSDDWHGLFPGLGYMDMTRSDGDMEWSTAGSAPKPAGWGGSFIYAFLSDSPPLGYTIIDVAGLPLMATPDYSGEVTAVLKVDTMIGIRKRQGSWVFVRCSRLFHPSDDLKGWTELYRTGEDGLVRVVALPMI